MKKYCDLIFLDQVVLRVLLAIGVFLVSLSVCASDQLTASVDNANPQVHKPIILKVTAEDAQPSTSPNFSVLTRDFLLGHQTQSQSILSTNNMVHSSFTWTVTLLPKHTGQITIPSLQVGNAKTKPIILDVTQTKKTQNSPKVMFVYSSLDKKTPYVQQEVILKLQIYISNTLLSSIHATPLQHPNTLIKALNEREYEHSVKGIQYHVVEAKYSLFPQHAGALNIPAQTFSAYVAKINNRGNNTFDPFVGMVNQPRMIVATSKPLYAQVRKKPKSYPFDNWLPAQKLTVTQRWSQNINNLHVGDSLTRTLIVTAKGLSASQLAPIEIPRPKHFQLYPDKSQLRDQRYPEGIIGMRIETQAYVTTEPGTFMIPALSYHWFNTKTNSIQNAYVPRTLVHVQAINPQPSPSTPKKNQQEKTASIVPVAREKTDQNYWKIVAYVLILCNASFFFLWLKRKHVAKKSQKHSKTERESSHRLLKKLKEACQEKNIKEIPRAFCLWYNKFSGKYFTSFRAATADTKDPEIIKQALIIDAFLYSKNASKKVILDSFDAKIFIKKCLIFMNKKKKIDTNEFNLYPKD